MTKNLNGLERVIRLLLGIFALFAAWQLFENPAARVSALLFAALAFFECAAGVCWVHARFGVRSPQDRLAGGPLYILALLGVQTIVAYEWWAAGWEKITSTNFVDSIGKTLGYFASKNPFPWYKAFLTGFAAAHGTAFALAVQWGETAVGVGLFVGTIAMAYAGAVRRNSLILSTAALVGGLLMSANFYLAAGWTGAGTKGSNVILFWVQAVLLYTWASALHAKPSTAAKTSDGPAT